MSEQTCFFRPIEGDSTREIVLVLPVEGARKVTAREVADLFDVVKVLSEHQERQGHFYSTRLPDVARSVIDHYRSLAVDALRRTKEFRDDVMIQLRALSLVVEMAGSASTHREKDARLRGVSELIEGAIGKLRKERFEITSSACWGMFEDVFRSDYPTRELLGRIRELEAENRQLRAKAESEAAPEETDNIPQF